jgi:predicted DNA-binding transcriptional regulator AlpA
MKLVLKRLPKGRKPVALQDNRDYSEDAHNITRRRQYQIDPSYKSEVQQRSRHKYRKSAGVELDSCLRSLDFFRTLSNTERVILPNGTRRDWPVMDVPTTASVLQTQYQTLWRWITKGMVPSPALKIGAKGSRYHVEEVRSFIEIIGKHEQSFRYYRGDHVETRKALFENNHTIRKQLGIE